MLRSRLLLLLGLLALLCLVASPSISAQSDDSVSSYDGADLDDAYSYGEEATAQVDDAEDEMGAMVDDADEEGAYLDDAEEEGAYVDDALSESSLDEADLDDAISIGAANANSAPISVDSAAEQKNHGKPGYKMTAFAGVFLGFGILVAVLSIGYLVYRYRLRIKNQQNVEKEQAGALNTLTAEHVDTPYVLHVL